MKLVLVIFMGLLLTACHTIKLPEKRLSQYQTQQHYIFSGDTLKISLENPLHAPLRIYVQTSDAAISPLVKHLNPILLAPRKDTIIYITPIQEPSAKLVFPSKLGDPDKTINHRELQLPFPENRKYRIIQAYNGTFTHQGSYSRYAIDIALKERDTVCAATSGYVVGVIEDYKYGGPGKEWYPYSNFITLYDPDSGIFTQYVHLCYEGSLVTVGDYVHAGDPIGLSGRTGQTTIEHLHFNVLVPVDTEGGMRSIPVEFAEGYKGIHLKKNDILKK